MEHPHFQLPMDHNKYVQMAREGLNFHIAPYCWRILTPLLVGRLPVDLTAGFLGITVVSLFLTGLALYALTRSLGFDERLALLGVLMFYALGWAVKYTLYDFWLPDALSFLLTTLVLLCLVRRWDWGFVLLLAVGVAVKETVLIVAPLYYTFRARRLVDGYWLGRTALAVAPAVAVLGLIHWAIPPYNNDPAYLARLPLSLRLVREYDGTGGYYSSYWDYGWMLREVGLPRLANLRGDDLLAWSFGAFGLCVGVLPFLGGREARGFFARCLPMFLMVYGQPLFVVSQERNIVILFPVLIPLALYGAQRLADRLCLDPLALAGLPLAFFALHVGKVSGGFSELMLLELPMAALYLGGLVALARWGREWPWANRLVLR